MTHKSLQDIEIGESLSFYEIYGECYQKSLFELPTGLLYGTPVAYAFRGNDRPYGADPSTPIDENQYVFALDESTEDEPQKRYKLVAITPDFDTANRRLFEANDYYRERYFEKNPHLKPFHFDFDDYDDK